MESTLQNPAFAAARTTPKPTTILYWSVTALFCLEMTFTAYYELLPHGMQAFTHLGFSNSYFRAELSLAKLAGVAALLIPLVPVRLREWAYAGFAINLVSAMIAHFAIRDIPLAFVPSMLTSVLWALSYYFWHRRRVPQADSEEP